MRKKRRTIIVPVIPERPTANLTASMRAERNATAEVFENTSSSSPVRLSENTSSSSPVQTSCSRTSSFDAEGSKKSKTWKTKSSKVSAARSKAATAAVGPVKKPEKEVRKSDTVITTVNDVQIFDADVIGTFSQSSGTVSYDSIKPMNSASLEAAKIEGKYIRYTEEQQKKITEDPVSGDDGVKYPEIRVVSDAELNRRLAGREPPFESHEALPSAPHWGQCETILTKKCIDEVVENFFASPRDDIELTMRLSRRDMYPRLHIELAPLYADLQIRDSDRRTAATAAVAPFVVTRSRRGHFDDLLRIGSDDYYFPRRGLSMRSMEDRSASMCYTAYSDATTARPPSHDYFTTAYSYLIGFVKSVVPSRSRSSTTTATMPK